MENEQEDLYYEVQAAIREIFNIDSITPEQMNEFFFNVMWPERRRYNVLYSRFRKLEEAWNVINGEFNNDQL